MAGRYVNDEGEPLMTAAEGRFEDYLDMDADAGDPQEMQDYYRSGDFE